MLRLVDIKKDYKMKDQEDVHALRGVSINFRRNEFVAILGASGCGKTTLLNITGGLDRYTSGDLIIEGVSTKHYTDRDWDTYRNHSIGFVFQSYNLISHQTILANVELALTISGIKKSERKERARKALKTVGLEGMEKKKPNQLSGGQMQRVAIARALVNNPEIVLADEPTGALDSQTSVQIMDLLKEVARDRLVIMVTHNPDLALRYANRIVRMHDGVLTDDSNPYDGETPEERETAHAKLNESKGSKKQTSMSFSTAIGLSATNLVSKMKRTALIAIAGSIGIIGVSTVLAVSQGVTNYIDGMQDDMLSSYPLTIGESSIDYTSLMSAFSTSDAKTIKDFDISSRVGVDSLINYLMDKYKDFTSVKTNDINDYLIDYIEHAPEEAVASINMSYSIDPTNNIFTTWSKSASDSERTVSLNGLTQMYISELQTVDGFSDYAQFVDLFTDFMQQVPGDEDYIRGTKKNNYKDGQYDLVAGTYAEDADELMIVLEDDSTLTDLLFAQLGFFTQDEFLNLANKAIEENKENPDQDYIDSLTFPESFSYEEILGKTFTYYPHDSIWNYGEIAHIDYSNYSLTLNNADSSRNMILSWDLTKDVLTGVYFDNTPSYYSVTFNREGGSMTDGLAGTWTAETASGTKTLTVTMTGFTSCVASYDSDSYTGTITVENQSYSMRGYNYSAFPETALADPMEMKITGILRPKKSTNFGCLQRGIYYTKAFTEKYMEDAATSAIIRDADHGILNYIGTSDESSLPYLAYVTYDYDDWSTGSAVTKKGYASALNADLSTSFSSMFSSLTGGVDYGSVDKIYLRSLSGLAAKEVSEARYNDYEGDPVDRKITESGSYLVFDDLPEEIEIYPMDFDAKDRITDYLDQWNKDIHITLSDGTVLTREDREDLSYTDTISMIIAVINTLITTITIALVAFTSLSLVVSCFMIAVITYISVMERVKEIGVIRSLGGRKKDVSRLFIAETLIIGLASGVFGIVITYLLSGLINLIVAPFGVSGIAALNIPTAVLMILISVVLNVLSGLLPSQKAAHQDPVTALRSE